MVQTPLESEESSEDLSKVWCMCSQKCRIDSSLKMVEIVEFTAATTATFESVLLWLQGYS